MKHLILICIKGAKKWKLKLQKNIKRNIKQEGDINQMKRISSLDDFAKVIFEDKELFNGLCAFVKGLMELSDVRSKAADKILEKIYETKGKSDAKNKSF